MTDIMTNIVNTLKGELKEYFEDNPGSTRIDLENTIGGIVENAQINLGTMFQEELAYYLDELLSEEHDKLMNTQDFQNKKNLFR